MIDPVEIVDGEHAMLYLRSEAVMRKGGKAVPMGEIRIPFMQMRRWQKPAA